MESAYAASLPTRERRLAGRLEGFGDIVFGFAVSQCAIQLPHVDGHAEIGSVASLAIYFGTFAILASLWLTFHHLMSGSFKPAGVDLFLAFAFLALVTLLPLALYSTSHQVVSLEAARLALAQYAAVFGSLLVVGALITLRNLRRGWYVLSDEDRDHAWRGLTRRIALGIVVLVALAVDLIFGPIQSSFIFMTMWFVPRIVRMVLPTPRKSWLRIASAS
jgi:uncharacterized membrane protein